ncbi:hypothetical protein NE237_030514 [Protea cynaroides]|uniref:Centromere protein C n=1 Tax=Protea cynaroides TaxID=273540 RepID=A0A9Q0GXD1_9MAGN|nr:hypothetical protein NE237_030514 [Protea cynaroides]
MVERLQSPNLVDPLLENSTSSLFFRTFGDLIKATDSQQPYLESAHNHLKSMALKSPNKLLEQAQSIISSNSELLNSKLPFQMASEDKVGAAKGNDHPPERRPALNRKRARFSLKPITRKRASYKHHLSLLHSENDETILSSQETFEVGISSPSKYISYPETAYQHEAPQQRKMADDKHVDAAQEEDSVALKEDKVGKLLAEMLSADCMDLDGDGAANFLQEPLQFKPIGLDKLSFPDLDSVLRKDFEAPMEQLLKPRKALADVHDNIRRADRKASEEHRQLLGVSVCPQDSLLQQKSPLASLSFLKRRISLMNLPSDPFLALGSDMSLARHSSSVEGIGKRALPLHVVPDHRDADNHTPSQVDGKGLSSSVELQSQLVGEEGKTAANIVDFVKLVTEDSASLLTRSVDENSSGHVTSTDVSSNGSKGGPEDKIEDVLKGAVTSEQPEIIIEGLTMDPLHCSEGQFDQSVPTAGEYCSVDGHAESRDIPPEQNHEEHELNLRTPPNIHIKPKVHAHKRGKRTEFSHRQSLAGAGSLWESGVRRSNRIKIKPLEWWNGERFLYGRIHNSLETVIGLKYASPAKGGGKPTFRVKSYVSDQYKHLVEQAGLH